MTDIDWAELYRVSDDPPEKHFFEQLAKHNYPVYGDPARSDGWTFCPRHEKSGSHDPSLSIDIDEDGRILTYCQVCKDTFYSLIMGDSLPDCSAVYHEKESSGHRGGKADWLVAEIEITTEEDYATWCHQESYGITEDTYYYGDCYAKVKWSDGNGWRTFRWYRKTGYGNWRRGLHDGIPPLYGADRLKPDGVIFAVEGEKDADRLHAEGWQAVSTAAQNFPGLNFLSDREVIIIPDNDKTGIDTASRFARKAAKARATVRLLQPLGTGSGYDVSDWLNDGRTVEELLKLAEDAGEQQPPGTAEDQTGADDAGDDESEDETDDEPGSSWDEQDVTALIDGAQTRGDPPSLLYTTDTGECVLYRKKCAWIYGESGRGKTLLMGLVFAQEIRKGNHVIHVDLEEQTQEMVSNLLGLHGLTKEQVQPCYHPVSPGEPLNAEGQKRYRAVLDKYKPSAVGIDSANAYLTLDRLKPNEDDSILIMKLKIINPSIKAGAAVLVIDNVTKDKDSRDGWPKNSGQKRYVAWTGTEVIRVKAWSRTSSGYARLVFHKDHGGFNDSSGTATAAYLMMDYDTDTGQMSCRLTRVLGGSSDGNTRMDWETMYSTADGSADRDAAEDERQQIRRGHIITLISDHQGEYTVGTAAKLLAEEHHIKDARDGMGYSSFFRDLQEMVRSLNGDVRGVPENPGRANSRILLWLAE